MYSTSQPLRSSHLDIPTRTLFYLDRSSSRRMLLLEISVDRDEQVQNNIRMSFPFLLGDLPIASTTRRPVVVFQLDPTQLFRQLFRFRCTSTATARRCKRCKARQMVGSRRGRRMSRARRGPASGRRRRRSVQMVERRQPKLCIPRREQRVQRSRFGNLCQIGRRTTVRRQRQLGFHWSRACRRSSCTMIVGSGRGLERDNRSHGLGDVIRRRKMSDRGSPAWSTHIIKGIRHGQRDLGRGRVHGSRYRRMRGAAFKRGSRVVVIVIEIRIGLGVLGSRTATIVTRRRVTVDGIVDARVHGSILASLDHRMSARIASGREGMRPVRVMAVRIARGTTG